MRVAVAAVVALLCCAAFAVADVPTIQNDNPPADTDFTPVAKDTAPMWKQVGGTVFTTDQLVADSPTSADDDLTAVAFETTTSGFAGGSRELDCGGVKRRVPVIYAYHDTPDRGLTWDQSLLGDCSGRPGFVGSIAFMQNGRALAVGGDGVYPKREPAYDATNARGEPCNPPGVTGKPFGWNCDPAGNARAWLWDGSSWCELGPGAPCGELPNGMRGLTAVAFWDKDSRGDFGFAGGLGQIWRWRGQRGDAGSDAFEKRVYDQSSPREDVQGAGRLVFRIRQIRFMPAIETPRAYAVTDGCCAPATASANGAAGVSDPELRNVPRILGYQEAGGDMPATWSVSTADPTASAIGDCSTTTGHLEQFGQLGKDEGLGYRCDDAHDRTTVNHRQDLPDSFYSLTMTVPFSSFQEKISFVASPGGPPRPGEKQAIVTQAYCDDPRGGITGGGGPLTAEQLLVPDQVFTAARMNLSTARLVAGDGDAGSAFQYFSETNNTGDPTKTGIDLSGGPGDLQGNSIGCGDGTGDPRNGPDGVPDWVVGQLRSTEKPGLGAQALALANWLRPAILPGTVDPNVDPGHPTGYQPTDDARVKAYLQSQYYLLPSYALNAIAVDDATGSGWAVGEHGALMRLGTPGGALSVGAQPPPVLGAPSYSAAPDNSAYSEVSPLTAADLTGVVPPLEVQPLESGARPRLVGYGSPDPTRPSDEMREDVGQIVMSRDGGEGWAVGATPGPYDSQAREPTLYHYDGSSWSRCDSEGITNQLAPDPACAALAPLRQNIAPGGKLAPVRIMAATRVPYENDADPSNDDAFEVLAIGKPYNDGPKNRYVVLRYRDGRWSIDQDQALRDMLTASGIGINTIDLAFTSPTDGWILKTGTRGEQPRLFHFDGRAWTDCGTSGCFDPEGRTVKDAGTDSHALYGMVAAGRRVYLYGDRVVGGATFPLVLSRADGGDWSADPADGGLDPGWAGGGSTSGGVHGVVYSVSVADGASGPSGWAVGRFNANRVAVGGSQFAELPAATALMRLTPGKGWATFSDAGPVHDYLLPGIGSAVGTSSQAPPPTASDRVQLTLPDGRAFFGKADDSGRLFSFDAGGNSWRLLDPQRSANPDGSALDGPVMAIAADGAAGFWAAVQGSGIVGTHDDFFHYTSRIHRPVFDEMPNPLLDPMTSSFTALAGGPNGVVWATTRSGAVFRYERMTGWDRVNIAGWDPGRVVTATSPANAVAVGPDGAGVVVGSGGRIADLDQAGIVLDAAAGKVCGDAGTAPCGTAHDLRAAAVGPDGAAMVGGDRLALLYRPPGEAFRTISTPEAAAGATITSISLPAPGRAWLTTDGGLVFSGEPRSDVPGDWRWQLENLDVRGAALNRAQSGGRLALRSIAVDASGRGLAVGDGGLVLERTDGAARPWKRLRTPFLDDLTAVTLTGGATPGALVGGRNGIVLTLVDGRLVVARPADRFAFGEPTGPVVGLAVSAGDQPGQLEAWAATAATANQALDPASNPVGGISRLLHYSSDPGDSLLDGGSGRAQPLPDSAGPRQGELVFAAFGKTECRLPANQPCAEMEGGDQDYETIARRVAGAIAASATQPGGPGFALFTGDAVDSAGTAGYAPAEPTAPGQSDGPRKQRRWREWVADPLQSAGVPLFGAIGGQDVSDVRPCYGPQTCVTTKRAASAGDNVGWRASLAGEAPPWGEGQPASAPGLSFEAVGDVGEAPPASDVLVADPTGGQGRDVQLRAGGARTHYAFDVARNGQAAARVVVVDSSFGSLAASDPAQNPLAPRGGQLEWLQDVLCQSPATDSAGKPCTRGSGERAIVVSNTPTYSYGPGAVTATGSDATLFETLMFRYHVNVVVSGKLGWNGLYYATAPGVHSPCPGADYPTGPPTAAAPCGADAAAPPKTPPAAGQVARSLASIAPPAAAGVLDSAAGIAGLAGGQVTGTVPFVVASSAGGKFGPDGTASGSAAQGFWHGYTIVRLSASGDPAETIVEQRPVLDWLTLRGTTHVLHPGQRMTLRGYGREAVGSDSSRPNSPILHQVTLLDAIDSPAITHRYDLLEADPLKPWLPRVVDGNGNPHGYVQLDPSVATVDQESGKITTGRGSHGRIYALALLSVGDQAASYPMVFEPKRSYVPPRPSVIVAPALPQIRVLGLSAQALQAPPAPPPPQTPPPFNTNLSVPAPPPLPVFPNATAPPVAPPAPPAPPPPPGSQQAIPLNLSVNPVGIAVPPTPGVTAQPTPPVQPAPPSGARREAKQRQAATAKSEEGASERQVDAAGDLAKGESNVPAGMSRRDRIKPAVDGFTPLRPHGQPSAWVTGLEWGGGIGLMALALALGFTGVRPTPRRRRPEVPATVVSGWRATNDQP